MRLQRQLQNCIALLLALTLFLCAGCVSSAHFMEWDHTHATSADSKSITTSASFASVSMITSCDQVISTRSLSKEAEATRSMRTRLSGFQESRRATFPIFAFIATILLLFFYQSYYFYTTCTLSHVTHAMRIVRFIQRSDGKTDPFYSDYVTYY